MNGLVRFAMLIVVLIVCATVIATHGFRGVAVLMVVGLAALAPRTRVWRTVEPPLVRLTGTRQRAAALVMVIVIACLAAFNVYEYVHAH